MNYNSTETLTNFMDHEIRSISQWRAENISITVDKNQILIVQISSPAYGDLIDCGLCMTRGYFILTWRTRNQIKDMNHCHE